jgi:energy-coupling factor transport system substrate-specific component
MKLTGRQRAFLSEFLDIYWELGQNPLRYAQVAERLGVSKITAYDMLRVLEKRGLVRSEYVVPGKGSGPGRSTIVFSPTPEAHALFDKLTDDQDEIGDWETRKAHILQKLQTRQAADYENLLDEMLAHLPDSESPLLFVTEMITAVLLALQLAHKDFTSSHLAERLQAAGFPGELGLSALTGVAVALSFTERANRRITTMLLAQTKRYPGMLAQLTGGKRDRLHQFVQEALQSIKA